MTGMELQVATAAAQELRGHGDVESQYITAEFEPFSSAQRPDLVFWPDSGPNHGRLFVVELRMSVDASRKLPTPENLREHREFVETDFPDCLCFALATARRIDEAMRSAFSAQGIEVFDSIESGKDLAHRMIRWVSTPQFLQRT